MNRLLLLLLAILLITAGLWGYEDPQNVMEWMLGVNPALNGIRIGTAVILLLYAFVPHVHLRSIRSALQFIGILMPAMVYATIYTDILGIIMLPMDYFLLLQAGIAALLLQFEPTLDEEQSLPVTTLLFGIFNLKPPLPKAQNTQSDNPKHYGHNRPLVHQ
jgi:hypothetical protein